MIIHPADVETFDLKSIVNLTVDLEGSHGITKVSRVHPLRAMNVECHVTTSHSCFNILARSPSPELHNKGIKRFFHTSFYV